MNHKKDFIDRIVTPVESRIDKVVVNDQLFELVMRAAIYSAAMVDMLRKNIYYGKEIDLDKFTEACTIAAACGDAAWYLRPSDMAQKQTVNMNPRLLHAAMGKLAESGEVLQLLYEAWAESKPLDVQKMLVEMGDGCWYDGVALDELGVTFEEVLAMVIAKLDARFKGSYSNDKAINRDTAAEEAAVEALKEAA